MRANAKAIDQGGGIRSRNRASLSLALAKEVVSIQLVYSRTVRVHSKHIVHIMWFKIQSTVSRHSTMHGTCMVRGSWLVIHFTGFMVRGTWFVVCGTLYMVHGSW